MGLCLTIFSIGQGVREKYLSAKGVHSPKSLGNAVVGNTQVSHEKLPSCQTFERNSQPVRNSWTHWFIYVIVFLSHITLYFHLNRFLYLAAGSTSSER